MEEHLYGIWKFLISEITIFFSMKHMHQLKLHSRMRIYLLFIIHNHSSSSELPELWETNATGGKCQFLTRIAHFVRATQAPQEYLISLVRHFAYFCALRCPSTDHCSEASNLWWRIWIIFHVVYIAAWRIQLSFIQRKTHKTMIMTMIFRKKIQCKLAHWTQQNDSWNDHYGSATPK